MRNPERRLSERIPFHGQVGYFHLPPSINAPVFRTMNLSGAGVCLEAPSSFVPGAALSFHLITPDHQVADVHAQIIHCEPAQDGLYSVGVRFMRLAERDRAILSQQYETVQPKSR